MTVTDIGDKREEARRQREASAPKDYFEEKRPREPIDFVVWLVWGWTAVCCAVGFVVGALVF